MQITLDDRTANLLRTLAARRDVAPDALVADLLRIALDAEQERAEDFLRLADLRRTGGVALDEVFTGLSLIIEEAVHAQLR